MDALRDHLRNDLRHDLVGHRVRCNVNRRDHRVMVDHLVNRRSDLRDDDHRLPLDDRHRMDYLGVDDLKLDVSSDENRGHRMNDPLDDRNLDDDRHDALGDLRMNVPDDRNLVVNHVNRNCAPRDLKMDVNLDVSHDLRRNDRLGDH